MKGAIAELRARMNSTPNRNNTTIIGSIRQRLLLSNNDSTLPAVSRRRCAIRKKCIEVSSPCDALPVDIQIDVQFDHQIQCEENLDRKRVNRARVDHMFLPASCLRNTKRAATRAINAGAVADGRGVGRNASRGRKADGPGRFADLAWDSGGGSDPAGGPAPPAGSGRWLCAL